MQQLYKDIFQSLQIPVFDPNQRLYLRENLLSCLKIVKKTAPYERKESVVHSSDVGITVIQAAAAKQWDFHETFEVLYQSGRIISNALKQTRQNPWKFEGSLENSVEAKDSLTMFLAEKVLQLPIPVVTVTRSDVKNNTPGVQPSTGVRVHEEACILIILHSVEISASGKDVPIIIQDTDVMVLALRRFLVLGSKVALLMGTGDRRRKVLLKPIYPISTLPEHLHSTFPSHAKLPENTLTKKKTFLFPL